MAQCRQPRTRLDVSDTNSGSTLDMQPQLVHLSSVFNAKAAAIGA